MCGGIAARNCGVDGRKTERKGAAKASRHLWLEVAVRFTPLMQKDEVRWGGGDTEGTPLLPALNLSHRCFMQLVDTERSPASSPLLASLSPSSLSLSHSSLSLPPSLHPPLPPSLSLFSVKEEANLFHF